MSWKIIIITFEYIRMFLILPRVRLRTIPTSMIWKALQAGVLLIPDRLTIYLRLIMFKFGMWLNRCKIGHDRTNTELIIANCFFFNSYDGDANTISRTPAYGARAFPGNPTILVHTVTEIARIAKNYGRLVIEMSLCSDRHPTNRRFLLSRWLIIVWVANHVAFSWQRCHSSFISDPLLNSLRPGDANMHNNLSQHCFR